MLGTGATAATGGSVVHQEMPEDPACAEDWWDTALSRICAAITPAVNEALADFDTDGMIGWTLPEWQVRGRARTTTAHDRIWLLALPEHDLWFLIQMYQATYRRTERRYVTWAEMTQDERSTVLFRALDGAHVGSLVDLAVVASSPTLAPEWRHAAAALRLLRDVAGADSEAWAAATTLIALTGGNDYATWADRADSGETRMARISGGPLPAPPPDPAVDAPSNHDPGPPAEAAESE